MVTDRESLIRCGCKVMTEVMQMQIAIGEFHELKNIVLPEQMAVKIEYVEQNMIVNVMSFQAH